MLDSFIFENEGPNQWMNFSFYTSVVDNSSDSCTNYENDCYYNYNFGSRGIIVDSETNETSVNRTYEIANGEHTIVFNLTCVQYSCPQSITPEVTINKLPL